MRAESCGRDQSLKSRPGSKIELVRRDIPSALHFKHKKRALCTLSDTVLHTMQSFTKLDTAVINRAQRKRREVIVLREDSDWLSEFSSIPRDMLRRMASRGALTPLGAGCYAISKLGRPGVQFKAWQPLVHARLGSLGPYYLSGLTALADHRLTDISSKDVLAVIGFRNAEIENSRIAVGGRPLIVCRSQRPAVFSEAAGIETVTLSRTQSYRRSDATRTLVDALWHPELFGATETWVTAWGRGGERGTLDIELACRYAVTLGPSTARRVGVLLDLLGHGREARELIPKSAAHINAPVQLVGNSDFTESDADIDPYWRVAFNVRRDRIEGWLACSD